MLIMASLSNEKAGVILPHDNFGNHLDSTGKTIDEELEMRNFKRAGEIFCEIWINLSIDDDYPVKSVYVEPKNEEVPPFPDPNLVWYQNHIRESQYLL